MEAQKKIQEVGKYFNLMAIWSMEIPPEIPRNYSLFNFQRGNQLVERKPFHLFMELKDAEDVFRKVEELGAADVLSEKICVVVEKEEID